MDYDDYDLCLAFDVADMELECDFSFDIEPVQPDAFMPDETDIRAWFDAIADLPYTEKVGVLKVMMTLPHCRNHMSYQLECLHRARELDALEPTEAQLCAAGY